MNNGPLHGFRIVDLSRVLSGPAATMLLADQGADVIKIEPPDGDITRGMGTAKGNMTAFFLNINRGKRGVCLDLKSAEGREIVRRIAANCDVFVQNFRPGVVEQMGLGYSDLQKINPNIIYVSISGFGRHGPYAEKRVYDPVIQALSGITDIQADHTAQRPRMMRTVIPDKTTALTAAQAITAALLAREREGCGQHVELNMLDATIAFMWPEGMMRLTVEGDEPDGEIGQIAQDLVYQTTDGYITVAAMSNAQWAGACRALGKPEWIDDERFNTTAKRFENIKLRLAATAEIIKTGSSSFWLAQFEREGVPCAPVLSRVDMLDHEQVVTNGLIQNYPHPILGRVRQPRPAATLHGMSSVPAPIAPSLGQHNEEVLKEVGFGRRRDSALRARRHNLSRVNVMPNRCPWAEKHEIETIYHDEEWGVPVYDDQELFELLCLEGAQAGLSWLTILQKRAGYRRAFANFEIAKVARFSQKKREALVKVPGIVRHQQKINAVVENAKCVLAIQEEVGSFNRYIWDFVDGKPRQNKWRDAKQVPASTAESEAMSRALKKRGFKFVGSTTCYAFMQAAGLVNDHLLNCFRHKQLIKQA